jgi:hypothetical protein
MSLTITPRDVNLIFFCMSRRLLCETNTRILLSPRTLACPEADRNTVVFDFARARRHVLLQFQVKFSHWRQLPWVLFGVAHHVRATAQECAQRALRLFDVAEQAGGASHHWMSALMCTPGQPGWAQLLAFSAGEALAGLPLLERMCGRWKFAMVAERWIESRHALLKRSLRNCAHASALHVVFLGIQPMLRRLLAEQPAALQELSKFCRENRMPVQALQSAGFYNHPVVAELRLTRSVRCLNRSFSASIVELMYHVDSATLFQPLPDSLPARPPPGPPPPALPPAPGPPPPPQPPGAHDGNEGDNHDHDGGEDDDNDPFDDGHDDAPPPPPSQPVRKLKRASHTASCDGVVNGSASVASGSGTPGKQELAMSGVDSTGGILHDRLWCKYAVEHMRFLIDSELGMKSRVFSLGPHLQADPSMFLFALDDVLDPHSVEEQDTVEFDFRMHVSEAEREPADGFSDACDMIFFTIDSATPAAIRVLPNAPKISRNDSLAISLVKIVSGDRHSQTLRVALEAADGSGVESLHLLTPGDLRVNDFGTLRMWDTSLFVYWFASQGPADFGPDLQAIVKGMLDARSHAADGLYVCDPSDAGAQTRGALLERLESSGIVVSSSLGSVTAWTLSSAGEEQLRISQDLKNPQRMLTPRPDVDLLDKTTFEVMQQLQDLGWTCLIKAPRQKKSAKTAAAPVPADYEEGCPCVFMFCLFSRLPACMLASLQACLLACPPAFLTA